MGWCASRQDLHETAGSTALGLTKQLVPLGRQATAAIVAIDLCAPSVDPPPFIAPLQWPTTVQRLLTLAAGGRTHADWHQAAIGPCGLCWPERPLYEVVRS